MRVMKRDWRKWDSFILLSSPFPCPITLYYPSPFLLYHIKKKTRLKSDLSEELFCFLNLNRKSAFFILPGPIWTTRSSLFKLLTETLPIASFYLPAKSKPSLTTEEERKTKRSTSRGSSFSQRFFFSWLQLLWIQLKLEKEQERGILAKTSLSDQFKFKK